MLEVMQATLNIFVAQSAALVCVAHVAALMRTSTWLAASLAHGLKQVLQETLNRIGACVQMM